jgi:hypothetical protein
MQSERGLHGAQAPPPPRRARRRSRFGGVLGNEHLTATVGTVLLVLLAIEGATVLNIQGLLSVHVFVGLLLLGPVALKLAATGYRAARYYAGSAEYLRRGPPAPGMRFFVAPVLVLSTVVLFGTGVALVFSPHRGLLLGLHKASFIVWFGATSIHVLAYLARTIRFDRDEWLRRLPGRGARLLALVAGVAAGLVVAIASYPHARPWFHHHDGFGRFGRGAVGLHAARARIPPRTDPAWLALHLPRVGPGPLPGYLLIADRNNNRVLLVSPRKRIVWSIDTLRRPDDAFFTPGWRSIITNEEFNDTLEQITLRGKRVTWSYGHAGVPGSSPGYLNTPDDAYRLPNGDVTVADIRNCRIVEFSPRGAVARILGGSCTHDPPNGFASPNGDTPLPGGGLLVTEIGGYIDRLAPNGRLLWSVPSPVSYPSDAQLLPNGRILVCSFTNPGRIIELTRSGRVTWSFGTASGPDELNQPSLAVRLPNGLIAANDDYNDRVIVIDPASHRIVWQYGHTGVPSAAPGYLSKPDGIDFLPAATIRRFPTSRGPRSARPLRIETVGHLPAQTSRLVAVPIGGRRVLVAGGLVDGASTDQILEGPPNHLVAVGKLPAPTHDAAAVDLGGTVYVLGGGDLASTDAVDSVSPGGHAKRTGSLGEPLSDLGAAVIGPYAYIAGGFTGTLFATGILSFDGTTMPQLTARLPVGLRYAG